MASKTSARKADGGRRRADRARRHRAGGEPSTTPGAIGGRDRLSGGDQGGRGRRRQGHPGGALGGASWRRRYDTARREGKAYFADDSVYLERYLDDPRHIEMQVLADAHGNVLHLGERDCSIQRRHQKIVEETPSPAVSAGAARADRGDRGRGGPGRRLPERRHRRGPAGRRRHLLLPRDEHPPAGRAHDHRGGDRARLGARAAGDRRRPAARFGQADVACTGTRCSAGSTPRTLRHGFVPTPGRVTRYREPSGPGVRVDSGVVEGTVISELYDPMVAKLVVWDEPIATWPGGACCARSASSRSAGSPR